MDVNKSDTSKALHDSSQNKGKKEDRPPDKDAVEAFNQLLEESPSSSSTGEGTLSQGKQSLSPGHLNQNQAAAVMVGAQAAITKADKAFSQQTLEGKVNTWLQGNIQNPKMEQMAQNKVDKAFDAKRPGAEDRVNTALGNLQWAAFYQYMKMSIEKTSVTNFENNLNAMNAAMKQ